MRGSSRRGFLRLLGAAGAGLAARPALASRPGGGSARDDALGLLYDATRCVGCKACVAACKRANDLPADRAPFDPDGLWDAPQDLDGKTRNLIKLYKESDQTWSFVKMQCMHCAKPSCVSACPVSAMQKDESGRIFYDKTRCIGCRYCQVACPFGIPRFQWDTPLPQIVKCDLCKFTDVPKKGRPACAGVCPTRAVLYGRRGDLLKEAWKRIGDNPRKYQRAVYGEREVGGTNCLYLSAVPFEKLGLPKLPDEPPSAMSEKIQHTVYKGFIAPVALYSTLFAVAMVHRKRREGSEKKGGG